MNTKPSPFAPSRLRLGLLLMVAALLGMGAATSLQTLYITSAGVIQSSLVVPTGKSITATGSGSIVSTTVTTNANLTGHVTSTGNAAILGSFTRAQLNTAVSDADVGGYNLAAYGVGTAYALTDTAAAIDFGTTDPVKVLDQAGTYLLLASVQVEYTGATVAAETATLKLRRTNNTAADVTASTVVIDLPAATTLTHTYGVVHLPPVIYTTATTDDSLTIFGNVSAALGAGTIDATATGTSIIAIRLY
jgi:hypothetical protein